MTNSRRRHREIMVAGAASAALAGALGILIGAIRSGAITSFLNPRIIPRTLIGASALLIIAVLALVHAIRDRGGHDHGHESLMRRIAPLLVPFILLPAAALHQSADLSGMRIFVPGRSSETALLEAVAAETGPLTLAQSVAPATPDRAAAAAALAAVTGPIVLTDETFATITELIWDDPAAFAGREVTLTAFVYRRPDWPGDTWVAARLSIWCCVADAAVVGLLARNEDEGGRPPEGQWVRLTGTLGVRPSFAPGSVAMTNVPELHPVRWERTAPPQQEYVFPVEW
jgi:putative membrane protein